MQHAITEISLRTFRGIAGAGTGAAGTYPIAAPDDPRADASARRIVDEFPPDDVPAVHIPELQGTYPAVEPQTATYATNTQDELVEPAIPSGHSIPVRKSDRDRDRLAETRTVSIATQALEAAGWRLVRHCQSPGCGYDLLFRRGGRLLKAEVKGNMGDGLNFNLTPKELWRAGNDPEFVLLAVTSVLSPTAFSVRVVNRADLTAAPRRVTGCRLAIAGAKGPDGS